MTDDKNIMVQRLIYAMKVNQQIKTAVLDYIQAYKRYEMESLFIFFDVDETCEEYCNRLKKQRNLLVNICRKLAYISSQMKKIDNQFLLKKIIHLNNFSDLKKTVKDFEPVVKILNDMAMKGND